ncbi:uncharacterized protein LOC105425517 isoform X2 [Pogonomyrmex barbatus]|uniref:Uncharacterized protein LOC105425517 isoform X2 n=1 Tax=Pogonomyrmex barbatus TaxID=144034 RepID=A0A6I9VZC1_9HYME|nr:uncharacterized protein LOC105425517 isoform X2 [Pogonomyrmex barbatus]
MSTDYHEESFVEESFTAHDAQMSNNVKSETFDMKELINYYEAFVECTTKLGESHLTKPEVSFCMAKKLNFVNEDGTIRWNEGIAYFKKVVHDTNKLNEITKALLQCKEQEDAKEGTHEKFLKIFQCAMPKLKLVRQMM